MVWRKGREGVAGEEESPAHVQGLCSSLEGVYTEDSTSFITHQNPTGLVRLSDWRRQGTGVDRSQHVGGQQLSQ